MERAVQDASAGDVPEAAAGASGEHKQLRQDSGSLQFVMPPLPPPPSCPHCAGHPGAGLAAMVAAAARGAVEAAFAELQPALLQSLRRLAQDADHDGGIRRISREHSVESHTFGRGSTMQTSSDGDLFAELAPPRSDPCVILDERPSYPKRHSYRSGPSSGRSDQSHRTPDPTITRQTSGCSGVLSPASTVYSIGLPTVQSLQADIAAAVLESSGLGPLVRRTRSSASSHHRAEAPQQDRARVLPQPEVAAPRDDAAAGEEDDVVFSSIHAPVCNEPSSGDEFQARCRAPHRTMSKASRASSRASSRRLTGNQVWQARIDELAREASFSRQSTLSEVSLDRLLSSAPVPAALRLLGVLPLDASGRPCASIICQGVARTFVLGALAVFILLFALPPELLGTGDCEEDGIVGQQRIGFLSEVSLPLGAALVLLAFGLRRYQQRLEDTFWLVRGVSVERRYEEWEARRQRRDVAVFTFIWLCTVIAAGLDNHIRGTRGTPAQITLHVCLTAIFSGVVLCLAYGTARICRSLIVMIDTFCCDIVGNMQLQQVAHVWNLTQAVLRKASTDAESSLLVLCIVLAFSVPFLAIDMTVLGMRSEDMVALLPGLCVTCGILYALLLAAMVSEKSARVPALINAVSFGPGTELARQHTVDFVTSSAAGFYILDMLLTTSRVAKFMYLWCLVVMGILTQLAASR